MPASRLRVIHPRHEQTAAYMALGAALATGKPQAFAVVPGPGMLNAGAALLTAYGMNAPVIGLIGQIPQADIDKGHGHLHEIHDQLGLMRHITKWAERIRSPQEAPALVSQAIWHATSGRPRPVALECALDTWAKRAEVRLPDKPLPQPAEPIDDEAITAAAKILGAAERPIIVVGGGALDAGAEVIQIAEMLEAPVSSYRRGRGVVPSSHRLAVDMPVGHRLWKDADAVLAVGTRFFIQNGDWGIDSNLKVVRLDIDPDEHERYARPDVALVGDAAPQLRALIAALPGTTARAIPARQELKGHRAWLAERLSRLEPQLSFLKAIRAALPEDGIFVDEVSPDRLRLARGAADREAAHLPVARLPGQSRLGPRHGARRQGGDARREGPGDRRRRRLHVPGGRARHRRAPQARRRRRGVRQWRLRQREAHPAGALRQPPDRLGPAEPGLLQARGLLRHRELQGARRPAARGGAAQGLRARCARPGLGAARRRAEPVGHDHDARVRG